ncbi:hypothetical protein, partial [Streptomyces sp. SA3_actF]
PQQPPYGTVGAGGPGDGGGGGGKNSKRTTVIVAVVCAVAVLAAAGGTAAYVVDKRDDKKTVADDGKKSPSPTASTRGPSPTPTPSSRNTGREEPTIPGWQVVANPKFGTVFEVPADWEVELADASRGYEWEDKEETTGYGSVSVNRPAYYKSDWCSYVDKKDGKQDLSLGLVGTRGEQGAKSTDEAAETRVPWWVYGGFTYPDKKTMKQEKAKPYTTKSGLTGSVARAWSENNPRTHKCASDGKAIVFAFKNGAGDYVSWDLSGPKGVAGEVPEELVQRILSTVRLTKTAPKKMD